VFAPGTCSRARLQRVAQNGRKGLIRVRALRRDVERVLVYLAVACALVLTGETVRVAAQRGAEQLIDNRGGVGCGHGEAALIRRVAGGVIYSETRRRGWGWTGGWGWCRVRVRVVGAHRNAAVLSREELFVDLLEQKRIEATDRF
jgi:hypothetical protein